LYHNYRSRAFFQERSSILGSMASEASIRYQKVRELILASDAPRDSASLRAIASAFLTALCRLPERPDLIHLAKMPLEIRGRPNPLATDERAVPCSMNGNLVEFGDDFEDYRASIERLTRPLARSASITANICSRRSARPWMSPTA
jgi:hypothetical protein